mgnify:CR=1 FL=1
MVATIFPHGNSIMYYGYVKFGTRVSASVRVTAKVQSIRFEEIVSPLVSPFPRSRRLSLRFDSALRKNLAKLIDFRDEEKKLQQP